MKKWSIGDGMFFKCHQNLLGSLCLRAGPSLSRLRRQLKFGMHSYESYHCDAHSPPKSKLYKSKDHVTHLKLWLDGDIQALLDEGKCIQKRLGKATSPSNSDATA